MKKLIFFFVFLLFISLVYAQTSRGPWGPKVPERRGVDITMPDFGEETLFQRAVKNPLLWMLVLASGFWISRYEKEKKTKYFMYLGAAILVGYGVLISVLVSSIPSEAPDVPGIFIDWQENYNSNLPIEHRTHLAKTDYYDFDTAYIKGITDKIAESSRTEEEAVQITLNYVFGNVIYDFGESDSACFQGTGSSVLKKKIGQCDTQSIAVLTLLRGMGIASRPAVGCLSTNPTCDFQQSLFAIAGIEKRRPKWVELGEIDPDQEVFSRRQRVEILDEIISRQGGLHAWVEYWSITTNEWITIEPTSGEVINEDGCYEYEIEMYPSDDDKTHLCVSTDIQFAMKCAAK